MEKQKTGFKFGKNRTRVIEKIDEFYWAGRKYQLVLLEADGKQYHSLRLYNAKGKFIKQFMTEPIVADLVAHMYRVASNREMAKWAQNLASRRKEVINGT